MNKILRFISVLLLIVSSLRFLIILIFGIIPSSTINYFSTIILFVFVIIFSKPVIVFFERNIQSNLYQIILLNFVAGILWFSTSCLINGFSIGSVREFLLILLLHFRY